MRGDVFIMPAYKDEKTKNGLHHFVSLITKEIKSVKRREGSTLQEKQINGN